MMNIIPLREFIAWMNYRVHFVTPHECRKVDLHLQRKHDRRSFYVICTGWNVRQPLDLVLLFIEFRWLVHMSNEVFVTLLQGGMVYIKCEYK
jgi:hypothetical protein